MKTKKTESAKELPILYVGMDVHLKNWSVCILGDQGFEKRFSCNGEIEVFEKTVKKMFPNFQFSCAYEAGFCGFWIYDAMNKLEGFSCIVVNPADIPTTNKELSQKDDPRDAKKIAQQLKAGSLKGIYVPKETELGLRELQRLRFSLVKDQSRIKNRIKSLLNLHGIKAPRASFPNAHSHWSGRYIQWLKELKFSSSEIRFVLDQQIEMLASIRKQVAATTLKLRKQILESKKKETFNALLTITGIGPVSAATIITEIVEMKRFSSYDHLFSYIGFIPGTGSSGEKEVIKGLTSRCNTRLRTIFIESAWISIKHNEELYNIYHTLKLRMSSNKAIIRVAKKLAVKVRYKMLEIENKQIMQAA